LPASDYNPRHIGVVYHPAAQLPPGWSTAGIPPGGRAADLRCRPAPFDLQGEALTNALALRYGLRIRSQIYADYGRAASFEVPAEADGELLLQRIRREARAFVAHAVFNPVMRLAWLPDDPALADPSPANWVTNRLNLAEAWDFTRGNPNVIVAVLDSGINLDHEELSHIGPALRAKFPTHYFDIIDRDYEPEDVYGHGTQSGGTLAAKANNGRGGAGIAPDCTVVPIRIARGPAGADAWEAVDGIETARQIGARIICFSVAEPTYDLPLLTDAVNAAVDDGILFVCAAGNDNRTELNNAPAYLDSVFCVGAIDANSDKTPYSNWGPYVDFAAPAEYYAPAIGGPQAYGYGTGTSSSAAVVAGAAALMLSVQPSLTSAEIIQTLKDTGGQAYFFMDVGLRSPRIYEAVQAVAPPMEPAFDRIELIGPAAGAPVLGAAVGLPIIEVRLNDAHSVVGVRYRLDGDPLDSPNGDFEVSSSDWTTGFRAVFPVGMLRNQTARLYAEAISPTGHTHTDDLGPLHIFNRRGDANADGTVNSADLQYYHAHIGAPVLSAPFADTDGDGVVTEADAAAVGYHWQGDD
jgi:hypothetical protein